MFDRSDPPELSSPPDYIDPWFDRQTYAVVGFYRLEEEAQEAVLDIFFEGLSDVVAAMWGVNRRAGDPVLMPAEN
jgi:hypothetical protein